MIGALPAASVIVPTRDRPEELERCIAAIEALDYPKELLEVVVVEDVEGRGPAAARNEGISRSSGELLAFTDDDCVPEPKWLELLARMVGDRERLAGGHTVNAITSNPYAAASQAITDAVYAHYNADPVKAGFLASNNLAGPRGAFERLGGFDERFSLAAGEDRDLCSRWLEQGGELVYVPGAIVGHSHELRPRRFLAPALQLWPRHLSAAQAASRAGQRLRARARGDLRHPLGGGAGVDQRAPALTPGSARRLAACQRHRLRPPGPGARQVARRARRPGAAGRGGARPSRVRRRRGAGARRGPPSAE